MAKDHSSGPDGAGYPTIEKPHDWGYTNQGGDPRTFVVSFVHPPGERNSSGHGQLVNGYLYPEPGDTEWLTSPLSGQFENPIPLYLEKVSAGATRGEPGTLHRLNPPVMV